MGGAPGCSSLTPVSLPLLLSFFFPLLSLSFPLSSSLLSLASLSPLYLSPFLSNVSLANQSSSILYIPPKILLAQKFPFLKNFFSKTLFCGSSAPPSSPPKSFRCSKGREPSAWGWADLGGPGQGVGPAQRPCWGKRVPLGEGVRA